MTDQAWVTCAGSSHTSVSLAVTGDQARLIVNCSVVRAANTTPVKNHITFINICIDPQSGLRTIFFKTQWTSLCWNPPYFASGGVKPSQT